MVHSYLFIAVGFIVSWRVEVINKKRNDQKSTMARNLGHARADDIVNETKSVSDNTLNYR